MDGHLEGSRAHSQILPPTNVRILYGEDELAEAIARAAESAKRLHDRLAARAARDAWMAEHTAQGVGWLRFVRGPAQGKPLSNSAAARPGQRAASSPRRTASTSPAA
jgi:hypothetical protein